MRAMRLSAGWLLFMCANAFAASFTESDFRRELGVAEKLKTMTEAQALSLLSKNGKLVKRPFVLLKDRGLVGFQEADWKAAFK